MGKKSNKKNVKNNSVKVKNKMQNKANKGKNRRSNEKKLKRSAKIYQKVISFLFSCFHPKSLIFDSKLKTIESSIHLTCLNITFLIVFCFLIF